MLPFFIQPGGSSLPIEYLWKEFTCKQNLDPSCMDQLRTLTQQVWNSFPMIFLRSQRS